MILGTINTFISYCIYVLLLNFFTYNIAYAISFVIAAIYTFYGNKKFVFRQKRKKSIFIYMMIYILCYLISFSIFWVVINYLYVSEIIAPLFSILIALPINYLIVRLFFELKHD